MPPALSCVGVGDLIFAAMKDTYYFSHDFNARSDPKLQEVLFEHGVAGIGIYWILIENLYEQNGILPLTYCKSIAFALRVESKVIESIIFDFNLFENDGEKFWSNSVNARMGKRKEIKEKRKKAAISSWESRRIKQMQSKPDAHAMDCNAIKGKESKGNNISISEDIEREEAKTAKRFCPPTLQEVQAYIQKKGYTVDAEAFIAFYQSKNWMIGKNKMKDWKSAMVTWQKRTESNTKQYQRYDAEQRRDERNEAVMQYVISNLPK